MTINPKTIQSLASIGKNAFVTGNAETAVSGITHDSREVQNGDLFVCLTGANFDGHKFAADALAKGAAAIVAQTGGLEAAGVTLPETATVLTVPDTRRALPLLACALYDNPSHAMLMVGVTGTNGKTTVTRMIAAILRASGPSQSARLERWARNWTARRSPANTPRRKRITCKNFSPRCGTAAQRPS